MDDLVKGDYDAAQAEKRDRINGRAQVWNLLMGLIGAFGLLSVQPGQTGYLVALYPLVAACVVRFAVHSECVIDQIKAYLLSVEDHYQFAGYEHFNKAHKRLSRGGHRHALRDVVLLTDGIAFGVIAVKLLLAGWWWVLFVVVVIDVGVMLLTLVWLRRSKHA